MKQGDIIIAGTSVGRVRAMVGDKGQKITSAGPSVPVEITGMGEVPGAGDDFHAVADERMARELVEQRKAEEKAARKAAAAKQREVERKYYKPDTPRYKRLRLIWWILLIAAIGCTTLSFVGQQSLPPQVAVVTLILAYVFIIAAFVLDFWKIKKERVAYQERMLALEEKNAKAEKQARRVQQAKQVKVKLSLIHI
mgnify:FL=1